MNQTKEKIKHYISNAFVGYEIEDDENFFELGLAHSLFIMQIILFIEKEFGIELDPDEIQIENLNSINSITKIIEDKRL